MLDRAVHAGRLVNSAEELELRKQHAQLLRRNPGRAAELVGADRAVADPGEKSAGCPGRLRCDHGRRLDPQRLHDFVRAARGTAAETAH